MSRWAASLVAIAAVTLAKVGFAENAAVPLERAWVSPPDVQPGMQ